jgi:UDP-N-acetylmuramoyl-L-alanyl-D-glutamate--2,6-diaminopimelate ligase
VRVFGLQPTAGVTGQPCDVFAAGIDHAPDATSFDLHWWGGHFPVGTRLIGEFNVANVLCAATVALSLGVAPEAIQAGVAGLSGVLGRMQRMDVGQPFLAVVDFAHSPASLERALLTLRPLTVGRLIAVFGSAGLRDRAKRRLMGQVAGRLADFSVITAEDPRTEDLDAINQEIAAGVAEHASSDASSDAYADAYAVVPDRGAAIQRAVDMAQPGDVVAAFGKGHERSMCFGVTEYPWNEQEAMLNALRRRMGLPGGDPTLYRLPTAGV